MKPEVIHPKLRKLAQCALLAACALAGAAQAATPKKPIEFDAAVSMVVIDAANCKKPTGWLQKIKFAAPHKWPNESGLFVLLQSDADDDGAIVVGPLVTMQGKAQLDAVKGRPICLR